MQVTSTRQSGHGRAPRPFVVVMLLSVFAGFATAAQAADFDAKAQLPRMGTATQARAQAQSFASRYGEVRRSDPALLVTNASLARQQFDMVWQLQRAIDEGRPLDEFASLGIVDQGNGAYRIDMGKYPEWNDLYETIVFMLTQADLDASAQALIDRGFRPEDVATVKAYVASHDAAAASRAAALPIALGFARTVKKYDKLRIPVPDSLVLSYFYQRERATTESKRAWASALLGELDAQRRRVLISTFFEMETTGLWAPTNTREAIDQMLEKVRQPNFEEMARQEAKGVTP
ncbi:MAG TPA: hypothetical protein VFP37_11210 [Steroidobacteraceae bacterium]|nr:hypothetical protein [Steroidobacteraceae bacterium]